MIGFGYITHSIINAPVVNYTDATKIYLHTKYDGKFNQEESNRYALAFNLNSIFADRITKEHDTSSPSSFRKDGQLLESTSSNTVNQANKEFDKALSDISKDFIILLKRTDFDDCEDNEAIMQVQAYRKYNRYVTNCWLHSLYSENINDPIIIAGLLRIIGMVEDSEDRSLLTIVTAGLNHKSVMAQEAAIMVIEKWRSKNCLEALKNTLFASVWIKEYAESIIHELEIELLEC